MSNPSMKKADIIAVAITIPICLYVFYESTRWPVVALLGRPFIIPRGVAICLLTVAGILLYRALTGRSLSIEKPLVGGNRRRVILVAALTFSYLFVVVRLGFVATTSLFLMLFIAALGERRYLRIVLFAIPVSLVVFAIFSSLLHVPLPRGWIENTLRDQGFTLIFR